MIKPVVGPSAEQIAAMLGVPVANIRRQFAKNAKELRQMEATARKLGKYRGQTAEQWAELAKMAEIKSR